MGRIHVLSEQVANKIAAGEVVERPASVVKELLENALDAGATRIKISVEAGGKKLIQITDNGCGMVRDDAMLAFERHATSKIKDAEDLLSVATLGFRGEALPSIASVSRLRLETCAVESGAAPSGTIIEINGGKMARVEEAGLPEGTSITVRDLFFNTPARKKFLKAESTELSHIASLVTHYALAHPEKHFELHSAANAMLVAPPGRRIQRARVSGVWQGNAGPVDCGRGGAGARTRWPAATSAMAAEGRKATRMRGKMSNRARCGCTASFRSRRSRS